jgi:hypothetical protein
MKENYGYLVIMLAALVGCGGGGGGSSDPVNDLIISITVSLSASADEVEVGSPITLTWSSTNAQTCSATGDWSGSKAVSGNEVVTINKEGGNTFALNCSANNASSGSASVEVTGVLNIINITNEIFSNRISDCASYADNYVSNVRDLTRVIDFEGYVNVEVFDTYCNLSSDNIPNHDFNDSSANFRTNVAEIDRVFRVQRDPQMAPEISQINRQAWDAVMLNGVVADVKSAGCYKPSESRADADGNTEAGCGPNDNWMLIPLEYSTKFGADIHNAHVQPDGTYHYHGNPNAMFDDSPSGEGSPVIGFAADGFPIYGSYILDSLTGSYRKALSGYTLKEGTRGSIVEIYLLDPLEDSRNFCVDIVGSKANADTQRGLQAHTCYSYQGEISVDQGFDKNRISEQEFFMPSFEVCMTFNSSDNDLALGICNGSELQKFTFLTNGNIVINSDPSLCVTVDQNDAREGGGGNPVHLIRELKIEECRESLSMYQSWGIRSIKTSTNPGGEYSGIYEEDWEWTDSGDLDECNGMEYKEEYGYYVTESFPYIINCFKGETDSSFNK